MTISPAYFTVFHGCNDYGIECNELFLNRENGSFYLDEEALFKAVRYVDAVWVTNPIYCTSVYFNDQIINSLVTILELGKIIITDESLCTSGHELLRHLGQYKNFIGIYSPHKSMCINGNKFSLITYATEESLLFNDWVVALSGNLLVSNGVAVNHFLSDRFEVYHQAFQKEINVAFSILIEILNELNVDYDHDAEGYLVTVYFPNISGKKGVDKIFLRDLIYSTGSTLIPGIRNHFSAEIGFCFRINLCCLTVQMSHTLKRLFYYLKGL